MFALIRAFMSEIVDIEPVVLTLLVSNKNYLIHLLRQMIWENIFDALTLFVILKNDLNMTIYTKFLLSTTQSTTQLFFDRTDFWLIRFAAMICSESTTMKTKNQMLLELIDLVACGELTLKCNASFHIIHSYT